MRRGWPCIRAAGERHGRRERTQSGADWDGRQEREQARRIISRDGGRSCLFGIMLYYTKQSPPQVFIQKAFGNFWKRPSRPLQPLHLSVGWQVWYNAGDGVAYEGAGDGVRVYWSGNGMTGLTL